MIAGMRKGLDHGQLACGCRIGFRKGVEGSPVTVFIDRKAGGCRLSIHVQGMAVYDYREALRPSTRVSPPTEGEYEEEG